LLLEPSAVQAALPGLPSLFAVPIAPQLADDIDNLYLEIEPWVQYGFEVATAAIAWVPYVGFLSGLIMDGYFFGESIVASAVFNFTDFLRGDGGIIENLADFGVDVGLAFVWLGLDTLSTFVPLPPCDCYPPRPPVQGPFLALDTLTTLMKPAAKAAVQGIETEVDPTEGKKVDGLDGAADHQAKVPTKKPVRELVGELVDRFTGEPAEGGEEQVDEGGAAEGTNADLAADDLTNQSGRVDEPTGTVRAQGQIRSSVVAAPTSHKDNGTTSRGGNLKDKINEKLADLTQSLSPKTPSSTDDGTTGDADGGHGGTSGTE
jgi:hypothetical protein